MEPVLSLNLKQISSQEMNNTLMLADKMNFNSKKFLLPILKNTVLKKARKTEKLKFLHTRINGLVLPPMVTEEDVKFCSTFKTRSGDVFLITYPKSGTMWLSEIVRCIIKTKGLATDNIMSKKTMGEKTHMFEGRGHKKLESYPSPRYMFTHLPYDLLPHSNENDLKYIYLTRNPRDVAVSLYYFMLQVIFFDFDGTWDEFLEYFMNGDVPYGLYFNHVLPWWSRKDDKNVLFLKYEKLKKDLEGQVKIIAEFLGFQLSDEEVKTVTTQCTFQAMKQNPELLVNKFSQIFNSHLRKGVVGDWKTHFSDKQLETFNKLYQSRLDGSGLEFEFEDS